MLLNFLVSKGLSVPGPSGREPPKESVEGNPQLSANSRLHCVLHMQSTFWLNAGLAYALTDGIEALMVAYKLKQDKRA